MAAGSALRLRDRWGLRPHAADGTGHEHAVPLACLLVFAGAWIALGIAPRHRWDWLLENGLTFASVPVVVLAYPRRFRFSDRAYVQGTAFLLLHTLGSHYTYSEVPLGAWASELFGASRNHYDRLVHFAFGALMFLPLRELALSRSAGIGRLGQALLTVAAVGGIGAAYEVLEWLVAIIVDPGAGQAFLGTQGDVWDAQKDLGIALAGGALAALLEPKRDPPSRALAPKRGPPARPLAPMRGPRSRPLEPRRPGR